MRGCQDKLLNSSLVLIMLAACSQEPADPPSELPEIAEPARTASGQVVVQSSRPPQQMIPVLDGWGSETGGRFELVTAEAGEEPVEADFYVNGSLAETWDQAEADAFRPVYSETVARNIDALLRDSESRWTALSRRARAIVYNPEQVSAAELQAIPDYESLRGQIWRNRLCLSSSTVPGNRLMVALLISRHDLREAEIIVREWRANLASTVFADDEALLAAIDAGDCAIGIADTTGVLTGAYDNVSVHWFASPSETLVDVTTASVSRHARDPDQGAALLEW
ncbi:MAG: hypothetical protein OEM63_03815, partial [Gammaproteobacteria bacterium]|nr:hypothetical protein [Gammaproteobacteria bacterium]